MSNYEQEQREREAFNAGARGSFYYNSGRTSDEQERIYQAAQRGRNMAAYYSNVGRAFALAAPFLQIILHYLSKYAIFLILGFLAIYYPASLFMKMPGLGHSKLGLFCEVYGIVLGAGLVPGYFILCFFHYLRAYVQEGKRKRVLYWRLWFALLHVFVTVLPITLIFYYWSNDSKDNFWVLAFLAFSMIVAGIKCLGEMLDDGYAPDIVSWAFQKGEEHAVKRFSNAKASILPAKYRVALFSIAFFMLVHLMALVAGFILQLFLHDYIIVERAIKELVAYVIAALVSTSLINPMTIYLYNYEYKQDLPSGTLKKAILIFVPVAVVLKLAVSYQPVYEVLPDWLCSIGVPLISCALGAAFVQKFRKTNKRKI